MKRIKIRERKDLIQALKKVHFNHYWENERTEETFRLKEFLKLKEIHPPYYVSTALEPAPSCNPYVMGRFSGRFSEVDISGPFLYHYYFFEKNTDLLKEITYSVKNLNLKLLLLFAFPNKYEAFLHTADELLKIGQEKAGLNKTKQALQSALHYLIRRDLVRPIRYQLKRRLLMDNEEWKQYQKKLSRIHYAVTPRGAQLMSLIYPHMMLIHGIFLPISISDAEKLIGDLTKRSRVSSFIEKNCIVLSFGRKKLVLKNLFRLDMDLPVLFKTYPYVEIQEVADTFVLNGISLTRSLIRTIEDCFEGKSKANYYHFLLNFLNKSKRRDAKWEGIQKLFGYLSGY